MNEEKRSSPGELESYLWGSATLLRGYIDAGDYKQFIFPLLFYKRMCDVYDEEVAAALSESGGDAEYAQLGEQHRFQIPPQAHWEETRNQAKDVGETIQNALREIEKANPDTLYGVFGDAQWTNQERLPDHMLKELIEHFSSHTLTLSNCPEDKLGQGYEFLIKKFADDSGHTAAEFYTNRTVVHLMTEMLRPQPGESIYDPTCGSAGMLLSAVAHLKRQDKEWRMLRLYGQERNLMTSSIARMNLFLHGVEDFRIERGDTLADPKFVQNDRLMQFDMVLANPPYSIKQWDREAWATDPWGRNRYGTPPQGRADYAFWQHILASLKTKTGRCAILFPHGVLFRQEEAEMRRKLIEADLIECVLGLGPNLFYNSPMEACVVICRTSRPKNRRKKILLLNAVNEVTRERAQSFLTDGHIQKIVQAYEAFQDEPGFARVASVEEIREKGWNLSLPLFVTPTHTESVSVFQSKPPDLAGALTSWRESSRGVFEALNQILPEMKRKPAKEFSIGKMDIPLFDRSKWQPVRFGDVVENVNETEHDPQTAGIERFIGLEHMEPGSLHIRSWGNVADGTTFTRRCRPGQVLFGKRRAYQRKVAVAEFDAVVSGDIYVFVPKNDRLVPELLPFLCMSERFFQFAVGTSAGSLSPRTNWSSIAKFEFALPPLDQQRRIAEILWAVDENLQAWQATRFELKKLRQSVVSGFISSHESDKSSLGDSLEAIQYGSSNQAILEQSPGLLPLLRIPNVIGGKVDFTDLVWLDPSAEFEKYRLAQGDVLIVRTNGNPDYVGRTAVYEGSKFGDCFFASYLIRLRPKTDKLLPHFLHEMLQCDRMKKDIRKQARSSAGNYNLNAQGIRGLRIPLPPKKVQRELLGHLSIISAASEVVSQYTENMRMLRSTFLNGLFNEPSHKGSPSSILKAIRSAPSLRKEDAKDLRQAIKEGKTAVDWSSPFDNGQE